MRWRLILWVLLNLAVVGCNRIPYSMQTETSQAIRLTQTRTSFSNLIATLSSISPTATRVPDTLTPTSTGTQYTRTPYATWTPYLPASWTPMPTAPFFIVCVWMARSCRFPVMAGDVLEPVVMGMEET